jgi:dephospho-CoA kinase
MQGRVLALVGMAGSGKTVCAQHLERRGFAQFRFGSLVVEEVMRRGQPITPENERIVREELRKIYGMDAMAQLALPRLRAMLAERPNIVIDGLYSFSEYKTLQRELGSQLILVAIAADRALRYARLAQRPERPLTAPQALERDYQEIERIEKGGPIAIADYTLLNNGSVPELLEALDALLRRLDFQP